MFLLIDNYDSFTYNLVQAFYLLGKEPLVLTNDDPRILELATSPELTEVCLSPGPSNPNNAGLCLEFLKRLPKQIPVLGVCLGHQLLGYFAGAEVTRAPHVMHGKCSDIYHNGKGLFAGVSSPMRVGRYHSLVVISPEDNSNPLFTVTARGPENEVMALSYNDRPWVGVQFHPESILTPEGLAMLGNFPNAILPNQQKGKRLSTILDTLANGTNLSAEMAASAFGALMDGEMTPAQAGAFLISLRAKGETATELGSAVRCGLSRAVQVPALKGKAIDIVGTGGDGKSSFNCSTLTAITMAGMGYTVIKHGNRAVSSTSGAADAIEALGLPINLKPEDIRPELEARKFAFLFAPNYHPAFRNVGSVRRELGIRTIFNLLGPLLNPARPSHILLGVARPELMDLISDTLLHSHFEVAAVIHGAGGYDELTPIGPSEAIIVKDGKKEHLTIDPADYGMTRCTEEDLKVHTKEEAVSVLHAILNGQGTEPMKNMVTLNLALAIYLMEGNMKLSECVNRAKNAVDQCEGRKVVHVAE